MQKFKRYGIPSNGTFQGELYVGSSAVPSANLLVTVWTDSFADPQGNEVDYYGVWTLEGD
jgi:hypothetical protein